MRNYRLALLSAVTMPLALLTLSASTSRAEPCHAQTAARADPGLGARQSVAAQMHRQPTVASVAAAEKKVAVGAPERTECPAGEKHGEPGAGERKLK